MTSDCVTSSARNRSPSKGVELEFADIVESSLTTHHVLWEKLRRDLHAHPELRFEKHRERPGTYVLIGNAGADSPGLHNPKYDFNDDIVPTAVGYWVALAQRYFCTRQQKW